MSFNKKYVRDLETVKQEFDRLGEKEFIKIYSKCDAFIGSSDGIDYINETLNNYYLKTKTA